MPHTDTPPARTWSIDDDQGLSAAEFLIGHLSGRYVGDQDSLEEASVGIIAATLAQAGLGPEEAVDAAIKHLERGATIKLDDDSLTFEFRDDEPEAS